MEHLIDKDALVAEIERRLEEYRTYPDYQIDSNYMELCDILSFIDTLEVKEVDINEEAKRKWDSFSLCYDELRGCDVVVWPYWVYKQVCKYFFELGMRISNKAQK